MRTIFVAIFIMVFTGSAVAQELSLPDLLSLSSLSAQKFEQAINKKGYSRAEFADRYEALVHIYRSRNQSSVQRIIEKFAIGKEECLVLKTSSSFEFLKIQQKLDGDGFHSIIEDRTGAVDVIYQKANVVVTSHRIIELGDTTYSLQFDNRVKPAPGSIQFADDLLQFTSHEHLVGAFGAANVLRDVYYFKDNELSNCSVLFPNSSRQAVFIWKDESNLMELTSVIVGGGLRVGKDIDNVSMISENEWQLHNGLRPNMSLRQLIDKNGGDFGIFGKESPYFMKAMPDSTGTIDFKHTGVVLGCLNCQGTSMLNGTSVSAADLMDLNMSMHVLMLILTPEAVANTKDQASR